jgi:hypothetical protein
MHLSGTNSFSNGCGAQFSSSQPIMELDCSYTDPNSPDYDLDSPYIQLQNMRSYKMTSMIGKGCDSYHIRTNSSDIYTTY